MKLQIRLKTTHLLAFTIYFISLALASLSLESSLNLIRRWLFIKNEPSISYMLIFVFLIFESAIFIFTAIKYKIWKYLLIDRDEFAHLEKSRLIMLGVLFGISLALLYSILSDILFLINFRYIL